MSGIQLARLALLSLVFMAGAWFGLVEGYNGFRDAITSGQKVAAVAQLGSGVASAIVLVGMHQRASWTRIPLLAFALTLTLTGTLAPVVWGHTPWLSGAVAGAATLLFSAVILRSVSAHVREGRPA